MKFAVLIILVIITATIFISGCVQQQVPVGGTEKMTGEEIEQEAGNVIEQEMDSALGNISLEDLENELLEQG
jgi:outer membrane lipoprotein-sorting protein